MTSTNQFIDVVDWFSRNVHADLVAASNEVHPILQVDAIRFLYSFRNQVRPKNLEHWPAIHPSQLTKEQLLSVFPSLVQHISSGNYVASTYAAIAIDRILFIKQGSHLMCAVNRTFYEEMAHDDQVQPCGYPKLCSRIN